MQTTKVFDKNILAYNTKDVSIICNKGGTRSSKTWSILQLLYLIALYHPTGILISIVSETMPHLKRGCIRDFQTMLESENLWFEKNWNKTDKLYKVGRSTIEFFSADSSSKVRGPARDILFINECNNVPYEVFRQLAVRTRGKVFLDYNPIEEFWADEHLVHRNDFLMIHSTYKDNDFLTLRQIEEIEANKHDENWWRIYGLGEVGSREGLCIKNWVQVDAMPDTYKGRWNGLDFGFTNDPTSIVDVRLSGGEIWVDLILYKPGMTNPMIAKEIRNNELAEYWTIADSAEPKSIQELKNERLKVEASAKGPDSIISGIDILNRYKINVTKRSVDMIKELRNYKYKINKEGKYLNEPIDKFNHAIDALRYVALNRLNTQPIKRGTKVKVMKRA